MAEEKDTKQEQDVIDEQESKKAEDNIKTSETEEKKPAAEKSKKNKKSSTKAETIEAMQAEIASLKDQQLRLMAEYDNFRKRSAKEKDAIFNDSKANVLKELLPLMDNFERALQADGEADALKKGMQMLFDSFAGIFQKLGVESFGEAGETFDPNIHNAVMHIESEEHGENEIVAVFSKGYKLGDRIIREAMVQVAN